MKLTKCVNGHFYDEEKFESCPHCAGGSKLDVNAIFGGAPSAPKPAMSRVERDDDMTVPLEWTPAEPISPAAEETSPVAAETPAVEEISPVAVEEVLPVAAETPVVEEVSSVAEPISSESAETSVDIQSRPSFDTPLDFDAGFTEGAEEDEEGPTEEPEEFELLSKFSSHQADAERSEATIESESFVSPEPEASVAPEPFVSPKTSTEPESFATVNASTELEPFVSPETSAEPEPFVAPEQKVSAESEAFVQPGAEAAVESKPFVKPEAVQASWEMPQPNVEEIPTGDSLSASNAVDPELEDTPTELVDIEEDLVNGIQGTPTPGSESFVTPQPVTSMPGAVETPISPAPSPAATMFGASVDDDDDEHTVAFYDEIFVSKAPAAPVVPETAAPNTTASFSEPSVASAEPMSETVAGIPGNTAEVPEPEVFTAPPLQPAQALPTPCVGWLIALNGSHIGQDFHLRVGKNYIGRDAGMDIPLTGDKSVSRNKHAIVIYEPKHHKYFIQPGESNELVYVNDEVVLLPMPLKPYDVIVIGDIELWFMPLCDDQHNWSEVIRRLQEQM